MKLKANVIHDLIRIVKCKFFGKRLDHRENIDTFCIRVAFIKQEMGRKSVMHLIYTIGISS